MPDMSSRHPLTQQHLRYFESGHLAMPLQGVVSQYESLAYGLAAVIPDSPAFTTALQKLVESKDAAVRAMVDALRERGETVGSNTPEAFLDFEPGDADADIVVDAEIVDDDEEIQP